MGMHRRLLSSIAFLALGILAPLARANSDSRGLHELAMSLCTFAGVILGTSALWHIPVLLGRRRMHIGALLLATVPTFPVAALFALGLTVDGGSIADWNQTETLFAGVVVLWCYQFLLFFLSWKQGRGSLPSAARQQGNADDDDQDRHDAQRRHGLAQEHPGAHGADHITK